MRIIVRVSCFILVMSGCVSKPNKFSDPNLLKIAELQDRRITDSLIHFLLDPTVIYRIEAAIALGSVQDSSASLQLGTMLLEDPIVEARSAAAFALGQTRGTAAVNALIPAIEDRENTVVREALISLGKTISNYNLTILKRFNAKDSITQQGLAWGFYYLGLRGMADSTIVKKAKEFLSPKYSTQTRLGAAHFFSRAIKLPLQIGRAHV